MNQPTKQKNDLHHARYDRVPHLPPGSLAGMASDLEAAEKTYPESARRRDFVVQLTAMMVVQSFVTMGMYTMPVLAPEIARDIGIPATNIGIYTSIVYSVCVFSALLGGGLVPRFGALRVCQACLLLLAVGFAFSLSGSLIGLAICGLICGLGNAPPTAASSHVLLKATPPRWVNLVFSIKQAGVPVGGGLAGAVLPVIALSLGWRGAVGAMIALCLLTAAALQPWRAEMDADRDRGRRIGWHTALNPFLLVWRSADLRAIGIASGVMSGVQMGLLAIYVTYLHESLGLKLTIAGFALATAQIAGIAGRILWGIVADRTGRPLMVMAGIAFGVALCAVLVGQFTPSWPLGAIHAVSAVFGCLVLGWNGVVFAEVARLSPPGRTAEATGGIVCLTCLGMVFIPTAIAALVQASGSFSAGFETAAAATTLVAIDFLRRSMRRGFG
jgi:MFS family permease